MRKTVKGNTAYIEPVSISLFNKGKANKIFEEVKNDGVKVVLKNNKRVGMILSPSRYDEMTEMVEECRLLLMAMNRIKSDESSVVEMNDVMRRFGISQEDLDETEVDLDV